MYTREWEGEIDGDEKKRGSRILYITIMECKLKKGGQTID